MVHATQRTYNSITPPDTEPSSCHDRLTFLETVTIPEGIVLLPGKPLFKAWRIENGGRCTWTAGYALVFVSGDLMSGDPVVPLRQVVAPGEEIDLSVHLIAPMEYGDYAGYWMPQNAERDRFGIDRDADQPIWIIIAVSEADGSD
jgi:hypothetical protein